MASLRIHIAAVFEGVRRLFARRDRVARICSRSHSVLEGWPHCPKCRIIDQQLVQLEKEEKKTVTFALLGLEGEHAGEVHFFHEGATRIGPEAESSRCLTPGKISFTGAACLISGDSPRLSVEKGGFFTLSGRETQKGTLLDYDDLHLFGNGFLCLDLQWIQGESK